MTLAEFLVARIAEDEALARREPEVYARWNGAESEEMLGSVDDIPPGRLLAECEAKRRIVELHSSRLDEETPDYDREAAAKKCRVCSDGDMSWWSSTDPIEWPCATLCLLALPYADHPDYDEGWRP